MFLAAAHSYLFLCLHYSVLNVCQRLRAGFNPDVMARNKCIIIIIIIIIIIGLLRVAMYWPLSSYAINFDFLPCLLSSGILFLFSLMIVYPYFLGPHPASLSLHIYHPIDGNMAISSQSFLSDEGYHWFDVSFSPDVFILDVVLLGLASSPSQHSYLVGVEPYFIKQVCTNASTCSCDVNVVCSFQFGFREWFICVIYYHIN